MKFLSDILKFFREKYVNLIMIILLFTLAESVMNYKAGNIGSQDVNIILQALTGIATMAILYFAYFYITSKKQDDTARLELAVRPTLLWDIEPGDGGGLVMVLRSLQHAIYNIHVEMKFGKKTVELEQRHMDIYDAHANLEKKVDIGDIIKEGMGKEKQMTLEVTFTYYSEVGGKYVFVYNREVERKAYGFVFKDIKLMSAQYPWKKTPVIFGE